MIDIKFSEEPKPAVVAPTSSSPTSSLYSMADSDCSLQGCFMPHVPGNILSVFLFIYFLFIHCLFKISEVSSVSQHLLSSEHVQLLRGICQVKLVCNFVNRWGYINTGTHLGQLCDFLGADASSICLFSEPARSCAMLQASSNIPYL